MVRLIFSSLVLAGLVAACGGETTPKLLPERPKIDEKVTQTAGLLTETFRPNLDILLVVDNSGSMGTHQERLAANIDLFAEAIIGNKILNYHIGVINSGMQPPFSGGFNECCGKLQGNPRWVDRTTPDGLQVIARTIKELGTDGPGAEMFFSPVMEALGPQMSTYYNFGFHRPEAYLAVMFITDSEDSSGVPPEQFLDFLVQLKGGNRFFIGAAYIPFSQKKSCATDGDVMGQNILSSFFALTNATTLSLCDPDYGTKLAAIGELIVRKSQTMYLKKYPKKGTLQVKINKELLPEDAMYGWSYNPSINAIEFGHKINWDIHPEDASPEITYDAIQLKDDPPKS